MAEDKKYSFITVETDDDDDVVIQAGAPVAEARPATVSAPAPVVAPAPEPVAEPAPAPAPVVEPAPVARQAKKGKDAYRETTLEDLESAPMGTMQKVIIAVAILAVVAFAVYLFL